MKIVPASSDDARSAVALTVVALSTSDAVRRLNARLYRQISSGKHRAATRQHLPQTPPTATNLILKEAARQARRFLKAHRHSVQQELARLGALKGRGVALPATRSRGPRGTVRPAARRTARSTRGSPDDDPGEAARHNNARRGSLSLKAPIRRAGDAGFTGLGE
jgi:hypothetical protein